MINVRTIRKLADNDGLTLKQGRIITYKSGWQVADRGYELKTAEEAMACIRKLNGDCGVWYSGGIYYVDHSFRVNTKTQAMRLGKMFNQISILRWKGMKLFYC